MPAVTIDFTDTEYQRIVAASGHEEGIATFVRSAALAAVVTRPSGSEEWRPFRTGEYDVSSFGNVRRMTPGISTFVGRLMKPSDGAAGYTQVLLTVGGKGTRHYVHRMVAESFIGPCPIGHVVNHIDGSRRNNALVNIEYLTIKANNAHAFANLPRYRGPTKPRAPLTGPQVGDAHWSRREPSRVARGERMSGSKATDAIVREIRRRVKAGEMQRTMAAEFDLSQAQVSRIVRGTRWAHITEEN